MMSDIVNKQLKLLTVQTQNTQTRSRFRDKNINMKAINTVMAMAHRITAKFTTVCISA